MVALRPLTRSDLPKLIEWRNDPTVTAHLARASMTAQEVEEWLGTLTPEHGNYAYAIELEGEAVGYAVIDSIDSANRKCDVGLVLGERSCWGKGVCKQVVHKLLDIAFDELDMHRVCAVASERNLGSIKCFQSVGFREEGRLRDGYFRDGNYYDLILLGILEGECEPAK